MKRPHACVLAAGALAIGTCSIAAAYPRSAVGSPIYGVKLPQGYRDWRLISVAHEAGKNNDIRAILGNDMAVTAFRAGTRPFPDGTIIVRVAWRYELSARNDAVFLAPQSFVAGSPTNVQVIVKSSKQYSTTGGWGYAQFDNGKPNENVALIGQCYSCHKKLEKSADLVFTNYAR